MNTAMDTELQCEEELQEDTVQPKSKSNRSDIRCHSKHDEKDWLVRSSLQSLDAGDALYKLEALIANSKGENKCDRLHAKVEILKILMLQNDNGISKGYMTFTEAYEIFVAHLDIIVTENGFLISILDEHRGLPVNVIMINGVRYIILKSNTVDYVSLLQKSHHIVEKEDYDTKISLDKGTVQSALNEMDTEWDRFVAKILVMGDKSHNKIASLGLKDENLQEKFSKMKSVLEEVENAKLAAEDLVVLQLR